MAVAVAIMVVVVVEAIAIQVHHMEVVAAAAVQVFILLGVHVRKVFSPEMDKLLLIIQLSLSITFPLFAKVQH